MGDFANLFEQAANTVKAHNYYILCEQVKELKAENERLKGLIDSAFVAGRSKMTWQQFKTENKL